MQTAHTKPESLVLAIFGGSGDLTKRKLIPSLYQLFKQGKLPQRFAVLGLGRTAYDDASYRPHLDSALQQYLAAGEYDASLAEQFLSSVHYLAIDPANAEDYPALKARLEELDAEIDNPGNYIYYLSTPPSLYGVVPQHLMSVGLNEELNAAVSSSRSPSATTSPPPWSSTRSTAVASRSISSTASITSSVRRRCRTSWPYASPMGSSSRCGTVTTSSA